MTTTIKLYGGSDDLTYALVAVGLSSVAGTDEYNHAADEPGYLACSDGSIIAYQYDDTGRWRVTVEKAGTATFTLVQEGDGDGDERSDVAELTGDIAWVKWCGTDNFLARALLRQPAEAIEHATNVIDQLRDFDGNGGFDRWWDEVEDEERSSFTVGLAEILAGAAADD